MSEPLCRVSVHVDEDDHGTVDLALPRKTPVGLLMPAIVDIVQQGADTVTDVRRWRLSRLGGQGITEWTSLQDNNIDDGELLVLTATDPPQPEWRVDDPCHAVASVADGGHRLAARITAIAAFLWSVVVAAVAMAWSGVGAHATGHLVVSAMIAVSAAAAAIATRRGCRDALPCVTLGVSAVALTAVAGFLAVPSGPSAANFLLAAAAGFPMSLLLLRLLPCGTTCLTALATFTAIMAATLAIGVVWALPAAAVGGVLAAVSLVIVSTSARLTISAVNLAPSIVDDDGAIDEARAFLAHHLLTGLLVGSSASAALGALLVVPGSPSWPCAVAFGAVVGLVLILRTRTHVDITRRIALITGGLIAMTASFAAVVIAAPRHASWMCVAGMAAGLGALAWVFGGVTSSPVIRRAVDVMEYLALAAVVPLACWVGGLYGLVRAASLT